MPGTPVMIVIADQDLRRSVEFMLFSLGHEPIAGSFPQDAPQFSLAIVEENAFGNDLPFYRDPPRSVIVLSNRRRPPGCPKAWRWLVKPHLGEALHRAIQQAIPRPH